jgi:short-subunit dehydrogenase
LPATHPGADRDAFDEKRANSKSIIASNLLPSIRDRARFLVERVLSPAKPSLCGDRGYALITGASQGLGRAFAHQYAQRGSDLVLVALPRSGLPEVAREVERRYGVRAVPYETDLTAPHSVERLSQWIAAQHIPLAALVNNAGVGYNSKFEDSTLRENESCILLNNLALIKITRLMLPELKRHPRAHILNVASLAAFFPMPYMSVYAPTKTFILNFSLALRQELDGTSVSVSVLCPNGIRTNAEARNKIARHGLIADLTCLDPDEVARCAVRGVLSQKAVIVPGLLNQAIAAAGRIAPRPLVRAVVSAFWGKTARAPATA